MKKTYGITILGQHFNIKSDEDDAYIHAVSEYVNAKMDEIKESANLPVRNLAILTALNIADELFKERARYTGLKEKIRGKSNALLQMLGQKSPMAS